MDAQLHDVAVIGSGPYGLSAAAHLRAQGLGVTVIGRTMSSWREAMPAGMLLRSEIPASNISAPAPGATITDFFAGDEETSAPNGRIRISRFVDYGDWFAREHVPDICTDEVRRLSRNGDFLLELGSGASMKARAVVMATGHRAHARWPAALEHAAADSPRVTHVSQHSDLSEFAGRRVAVIGAGQSALETAALLHEVGAHPVLIMRRATIAWDLPSGPSTRFTRLRRPVSGLGPGWRKLVLEHRAEIVRPLPEDARHRLLKEVLGPGGSSWLRARVEPDVEVRADREVDLAETSEGAVRLRLVDRTGAHDWVEVEHAIAATGYGYDVRNLSYLDSDLQTKIRTTRGFPLLSMRLESSVPRLYFTGLAGGGSFGPVMRFVCGTEFASPRIARSVGRDLRT